jgi:hypothetical protein
LSLSWRERLKRAQKRIAEQLGLTQEDIEFIWENIGSFCTLSDERIREVLEGEGRPLTQEEVDKLVDEMPQYQFDELTIDIILEVLENFGYKLKKKSKKKQKEEAGEESESETENEEETEDGEEVAEEQTEEQEVVA